MRLFIYSQDGMGLGHLRRTLNIASEVVSRCPDAEVLVAADSPVAPFFAEVPRVRHLKLPTLVKTGDSAWLAPDGGLARTVGSRARSIVEAYRAFAPDTVLVDHMPVGALGELRPLLDEIAESPHRPELVLGLRDILDRPETIRRVWGELSAYDYLSRYDAVFVYGCREIVDSETIYGLKPHAKRVHFCNYVATRRRPVPRPTRSDEPLVLVMGGGGADAFPMAKIFLDAFPDVIASVRSRACVLTGPNMCAEQRSLLHEQARGLPVDIPDGREDAIPWLASASAVVTMAGYNSLCEVLQWRKPALVIPRPGPSAEQRLRSRLFSERGLIRTLDLEEADAARVAGELVGLLSGSGSLSQDRVPPLDGAENAAAFLLEGVGARLRTKGAGSR